MIEKTCSTCADRDSGRDSAVCRKCTCNDGYACHYREHPAVKAYKELLARKEDK